MASSTGCTDDEGIPSSALEYTKQEYWDRRFKKEETYDWLFTFDEIEALLLELVPDKSARILVLGCGTSTLSCDMYKRGWHNITSLDFSEVVIKKMRERTKELAGLEWVQMDMCDLQFPDSTFDYCLDKAALDAVTADVGDVWNPHSDVILTCHRICCEIQRVLRPGGTLVMFSFHQPHFRLKFLRGEHCPPGEHDTPRYSWQVSHRTVEGRSLLDYFCYVAVRSICAIPTKPKAKMEKDCCIMHVCALAPVSPSFLLIVRHAYAGHRLCTWL